MRAAAPGLGPDSVATCAPGYATHAGTVALKAMNPYVRAGAITGVCGGLSTPGNGYSGRLPSAVTVSKLPLRYMSSDVSEATGVVPSAVAASTKRVDATAARSAGSVSVIGCVPELVQASTTLPTPYGERALAHQKLPSKAARSVASPVVVVSSTTRPTSCRQRMLV